MPFQSGLTATRVLAAAVLLFIVLAALSLFGGMFSEKSPADDPIVQTSMQAGLFGAVRDTDKPDCRAARGALETRGGLRFAGETPAGSGFAFEPVEGFDGVVLSCGYMPSLSIRADKWATPGRREPPQRYFEVLALEGGILTGEKPAVIRDLVDRCTAEALGNQQYEVADVRGGAALVDCKVYRRDGGGAVFNVSRTVNPE